MCRIPPDWEPIDQKAGVFDPGELQFRERPTDPDGSQRQWQVRIAARQSEISVGIPRPNALRNLLTADDIKRAIAFEFEACIPQDFDKEKDPLPPCFRFGSPFGS